MTEEIIENGVADEVIDLDTDFEDTLLKQPVEVDDLVLMADDDIVNLQISSDSLNVIEQSVYQTACCLTFIVAISIIVLIISLFRWVYRTLKNIMS